MDLSRYQLFLFDFDGVLVNTERLHMEAYRQLAERHGFEFPLTFGEYCSVAHTSADGPKDFFYSRFPQLKAQFPQWKELYEQKCAFYKELLLAGKTELMPGVAQLLERLEERGVRRVVVTHSRNEHVSLIRDQLPALSSIPHWITREDYSEPKPSPEGYLKAIELHGRPGDRIVGFEDTVRGLQALVDTPADPVIVCDDDYPMLSEALKLPVKRLDSFLSVTHL